MRSSLRRKRGTTSLNCTNILTAQSGAARAQGYTERIVEYCRAFAMFPERGTRRDDLRPGLRIVGYRRRVTIAFRVGDERITIDRVLYGGRDLAVAFGQWR